MAYFDPNSAAEYIALGSFNQDLKQEFGNLLCGLLLLERAEKLLVGRGLFNDT